MKFGFIVVAVLLFGIAAVAEVLPIDVPNRRLGLFFTNVGLAFFAASFAMAG